MVKEKKMYTFTVYTKDNCPWCSLAKHVLETLKEQGNKEIVPLIVFYEDADERAENLANLNSVFGTQYYKYPYITLTSEEDVEIFLGGCTDMIDFLTSKGYKVSKI